MGGIVLQVVKDVPEGFKENQLGIVFGETIGDFNIQMRLQADLNLFMRMACNMIGMEPKDQTEVEEYATEFFNIICGRFVSKICDLTGQSARFLPTVYEKPPGADAKGLDSENNTIFFVSDSNEGAIFYWAFASQDK